MVGSVTTSDDGAVRLVTLDDGKVNALALPTLQALAAAVAVAETERRPLLITGRGAVFSAGFDLTTLRGNAADALAMLMAGAQLALQLQRYPWPLVTAVNGHAMAMGAFLVLCGDVRIGLSDTAARIAANEVAIGLTLPRFATALLRHRLSPAAFDLAAVTASPFVGQDAVAAGWFTELASAAELLPHARRRLAALAALDATSYSATKRRVREHVVRELEAAVADDVTDWRVRLAG